MKSTHRWTLAVLLLFVNISNFTQAMDCYYCDNCLNTQRGIRLPARSEDWCYKIVWRSGPKNQQIVSRGASSDCRQSSSNDPSMSMQGAFFGTARYCCRNHLCNASPTSVQCSFLFIYLCLLFYIFF